MYVQLFSGMTIACNSGTAFLEDDVFAADELISFQFYQSFYLVVNRF